MSASPGLRIGELAARCGRSVHAIRWYESQGLIPGVTRDASGRRRFTQKHVQWLGLIDRLRDAGLSVTRIRAYAELVAQGRSTLGEQRAILAVHRDRVAATIEAWQASLALLDAKLGFYDEWIATGRRPSAESTRRKEAAASRATKSRAGGRAAKPR